MVIWFLLPAIESMELSVIEATLTSLCDHFKKQIEFDITDLVPKVVKENFPEKFMEAVIKSFHTYWKFTRGTSEDSIELLFAITGVSETESSYFEQSKKDSAEIDKKLSHLSLHSQDNVAGTHLMCKIKSTMGKENHPKSPFLLLSTSNAHFLFE